MGIMDFVKQGTQELMIARPDQLKGLIIYKHPDQTIPMWSQLTVDSDEGAVFFKDGRVMGILGPGRHTLSTQNIPFLSNLVDRFTGGNVFISEVFFLLSRPIRDLPFGGKLEGMVDPKTRIPCKPRIFGSYEGRVVDPVKFIVGYTGQAASARSNEEVMSWVGNDLFMPAVESIIGEVLERQGSSIVRLTSFKRELGERFMKGVPALDDIGFQITKLGNFKITLDPAEEKKITERYEKIEAAILEKQAEAQMKQVDLDQDFQNRARFANLAGQNPGYMAAAQADALRDAGRGMAQGGGNAGVANLGAQMAMGVGMAGMFQQGFAPPQPMPQRAAGPTACAGCGAQNAGGKFCAGCGKPLAPPAPVATFCSNCGTQVNGKFCQNCGAPAAVAGAAPGG